MRKYILLSLVLLISISALSQDFSNKGKDFWVAYGYHQVMSPFGNNAQNMVLYIATEVASTVTVAIPGVLYTQTYNIPANTVFTTPPMPKAGPQDCRLNAPGLSNKGIHITSDFPVVAYAHIYNSSVSGACVLLPTNTLGKEYYSINYTNNSNTTNANCWFYVIATEPGITDVEIIPSQSAIGHAAGVPFTVSLQQGEIYNVMGTVAGNNGTDLTGSTVRSLAGAGICKRIGVFSGSGRIFINCGGGQPTSSDNYMVQSFPKAAWGRRYLTAPTAGPMSNNIYRVCVSDPLAVVSINGVVTALPLQNNFYYEIPATSIPQLIESDLPITVAQYITTQGACGNGSPGDPEVIYLSSVEQNIKNVLFNSNLLVNPAGQHYVHAIIPNGGTALTSFRIDGNAPVQSFIVHPQDPAYSYIQIPLALGQHTLVSDSGFNAIAYGYASTESYGYNAGTNVIDLNQQLEIETNDGIETTPNVCTDATFIFKAYFPDSTLSATPVEIRFDSIKWTVTNPTAFTPSIFPVTVVGTVGSPPKVAIDSVNIRNSRQVAWYSLPGTFSVNTPGVYSVTITTYRTSSEGCGNEQEYIFQLTVTDPPLPSFTWTPGGCIAEQYQFTETTPQFPKATYKWWWDFGDPGSGAANNSTLRNPTHIFSTPGPHTVKYVGVTTPGCTTDTVITVIDVPDLPTATITGNTSACLNTGDQIVTFTGLGGTAPYTFYYHTTPGVPLSINSIGTTATINVPTTVAGTFIFTLDSVNNVGSTLCKSLITGQIATVIVEPDATLTLTSSAGTTNQTVCVNNAIANITYQVGGSGTGANVVFTPAIPGVTGTYAGGIVTIQGTATASGVYTYTVTPTGPCLNPPLGGTITVTDDATINLSSAPGSDVQTVCINTTINNITYAIAGSATGASITAGALPAGVNGVFAGGTFTISGTPTVTGVFSYTVGTSGPCINPSLSGTITVNDDATLTLSSAAGTDIQTVCVNNAIINITYAIGGSGTGASLIAGALPAGVTGVFAGGSFTISGTPTTIGVYNFTVGTSGPCSNPSMSGVITVDDNSTINLSSAPGSDGQTVCINNAIANISYAVGGGGTGASITAGALPAGVTGSFAGGTFTISGTPTVSGVFNYTVGTSGPCINNSMSGTITVNDDATITLSSAPGTNIQTVCINNAITNITYAIGGSGTGASVITGTLPAGVTGVFAGGTFTISGSPTASGVFNFTVGTGGPCINPTLSGTITVEDNSTISLSSAPGTDLQGVCINNAITNITYAIAGGGTGASITAGALPAGVTGSFAGGTFTITGTPTVNGVFNYTVGTSGPCLNNSMSGTITVTGTGSISLTSAPGTDAQTVCINNAITNIVYTIAGSATTASITAGALPAGVTGAFVGSTFTISGTPTVSGTFNFTVGASGPCGNPSTSGSITVNANSTISLTSAPGSNVQTVCINNAITNISYAIAGGGTGASITAGALPAGVTGSFAGGTFTISGAPTASGVFNYTVGTTGPCINNSLSGTITVNANATLTLSSAAGTNIQTVCINNAITNITYAIGGSGTGASLTAGALPAGVTGVFAGGIFTISGTPTVSGTFNFTVGTSGPCVNPTLSGTITVNANSTINLSSAPGSDGQTVCINNAIANINYAIAGGGTGATITAGALPAGVTGSFAGGTFTITGTPTVAGVFNYTVGTSGPCINNSMSGTITVTANSTITLSSAAGTNIQTVCINNAITNITYAIGGSGTGASITAGALPTGVTAVFAGGTFTISGTPTVSGTFNFTVGTSGPCVNPTLSGSITVNDNSTITLSSAAGSDVQTVCNNSAIINITYNIGGGGTGATITAGALPAGVTGVFSGGVFTISGTPTASGVFNFTIGTSGPCINNSRSGSITVNPLPTAAISGNIAVCQNAPAPGVTFTGANGTRPYTFTYTINGGAPQVVSTTVLSNSATVTQPTTVANVFTYKLLSVQDGSSTTCSQVQTVPDVTITVNPLPTATISGARRVCINSSPVPVTFTGAGGTLPYTFSYRVNVGGPLQTISTTGASSSVSLMAPTTAAGLFDYILESVQDGSSTACLQAQTGNALIDVSNIFPNPNFSFTPSVCLPNAVVQFQNLSTISSGTMTFSWAFGDGSPNASTYNATHQYTSAGPFNVLLRATSDAGCVTDRIIPLNNVHPQPKADFSFSNPAGVCIGSNVILTDLSNGMDGVITQWNWDMGDGTKLTVNPVNYTYLDTLTYTVTLFTVNSIGCNSDTITKTFTVHPFPKVNAGIDRFILEGGQITLNPVVYGNNLSFLWTPNQYLIDNTVEKVKVNKPLTDMTYTLTVTARGGCQWSDDVFVKLLKFPIIPNTFTPNNDGIHDKWVIDYLNTYPDNRVQVFTRTGQIVFDSRGYNTPWDGTIKGKPLPFDTYYYIIEPGNGRDPITGYVTILK